MKHLFHHIVIVLGLLCSSALWAGLGDNINKFYLSQPDESQGKLVREANYSVLERIEDGIQIREFISETGLIFAVTWKGLVQPDLSKVLGKYFEEANAELAKPQAHARRNHMRLKTQHIAVEKFGHMRDVRGVAYIIGALPNQVKIEDLQ